jgi:SAM-dependent methyltransferase
VSGLDPDADSRRRAGEALGADDPTGWFEPLYAAAERGDAVVPWDGHAPATHLVEWTAARAIDGHGRRALVVGCGLGDDAEHVAGLGFDTVAFDISPTAIRLARKRFPASRVDYVAADLFDPPAEWRAAFDLVVESITVQALPASARPRAIAAIAAFVAPGGTLIVLSAARDPDDPADGPPWPLVRAEIEAFATGGVETVRIEDIRGAPGPWARRWRAEFARPYPRSGSCSGSPSAGSTCRSGRSSR